MTWHLQQSVPIPSINITAHEFKHTTGASLIHLECSDSNHFFSVGFRTAPMTSSGLPHILEHTVLTGSEKYAVRDPFFSMLKRSVNNFMNALTATDGTHYPFASTVKKDFDNLLSVYLDSVFFPSLSPLNFAQEGIRVEYNEQGELEFKGIVFSEMKAAMCDPSSLTYRRMLKHLFSPNCTYHYNSGGEPSEIINITLSDLKDFHAKFYHPSNAFFVTYGDLKINDVLEFIHINALCRFTSPSTVDTSINPEVPRSQAVKAEETFADDQLENKSVVIKSWLTCPVENSFDRLALTILDQLLIGSDGSPLKKTLLESGFGARLAAGSGFSGDTRTTFMAYGLQGTNPDKREAIVTLIDSVLKNLVDSGFEKDHVEGVLNRIEFEYSEVSSSAYPYPLSLLFRFLPLYMHTGSLDGLRIIEQIQSVRDAFENDNMLFSKLIEKYLLNNTHSVDLLIKPDKEKKAEEQAFFQQKLRELESKMNQKAKENVHQRANELKCLQDSDENLSCLPDLELSDIDPHQRHVDYSQCDINGLDCYVFELPTNKIDYFTAFINASSLPLSLLSLLPVYCYLVPRLDVGGKDYGDWAQLVEYFTGGIDLSVRVLSNSDRSEDVSLYVKLSSRSLTRFTGKMTDLVQDLMSNVKFSNTERISSLLKQLANSLESSVSASGHHYASKNAQACISSTARLIELTSGLTLVKLAKNLAKNGDLSDLISQLGDIHSRLFCANWKFLLVSQPDSTGTLQYHAKQLVEKLNLAPKESSLVDLSLVDQQPCFQCYSIANPVGYAAFSVPVLPFSDPTSPKVAVLSKVLQSSFLHTEIREKGGAYGAMCRVNQTASALTMATYRDPNPENSFRVFKRAVKYAMNNRFDDGNVKEGVFAVVRDIDSPFSPYLSALHEVLEQLSGKNLEKRQRYREGVLGVNVADLSNAATQLLGEPEKTGYCYLGNKDLFPCSLEGEWIEEEL
ncbi:hypothetical protein P9112_011209 [Eukaryota sp. TZLM1-RC]